MQRCAMGLSLLGLVAWIGSLMFVAPSVGAAQASGLAHLAVSSTGHGTAEGIRVDLGHYTSGDVDSTSESDYQVELTFSFSVSQSGEISGGGSGGYTDAHWHLYGQNGNNGSFDCYPPIDAGPFVVDVSGHAAGGHATVALSIPDATETNSDYDCGANYSGYATTTHDMADSLSVVGGDHLDISLSAPSSFTLQKTTSSGSSGNTEDDQHIWSFSFTPPSAGNTGGGGGGGPSGPVAPCMNSLTHVTAKPSRAPGGQPIAVRFHVSHAARASLIVSPANGSTSTVASLTVPAGRTTLVWGGWLGTHQAPAGAYKLTVRAAACNTTRTQTVAVTIH